ncbi:MAG TPA: prenyltransferase/squalene oxidase repeat-containing protein, partial [Thermoanaerobaculia bacterium]|nr:prenyltransferase/squalene oxidase repeat-containing protein [Thermoanaerobaculia bacterium]
MATYWSRCVQGRRRARDVSRPGAALASVFLGFFLLGAVSASAQPIQSGIAYLTGQQAADGSWESPQVLPMTATTEALRALQVLNAGVLNRASAVARLESEPIWDNDDLARRILVLAAEGRDVTALVEQLRNDADPAGGWGLVPGFVADTLTTSIALAAMAPGDALGDKLIPGLSALLTLQGSDGGWPCVEGGDSEVYCSSYAILGLAPYRARFFLDPQVSSGAASIKARLNASGSFGPAGPSEVLNTALAALSLAAVPAISTETVAIRAFLESRQGPDGSWDGDPYTTALAVQALDALAKVPYCGDGLANLLAEACDGADVKGATCGGLGLGTGTVSCTASCTLDTNACSGPPRCGDGILNVAGEVCDGADLGGDTCVGLGLGPGTLSCGSTCKFDTSACTAAPSCGDGVINQASEVCDGADLGGLTCSDSGFLGGTLSCNADCTLNAASCTGAPFCGDGEINRSEEECDQLNLGGRTCDSLGLGGGSLGCTTACKLQTAGCASSGATDPRSITLGPSSPVCSGQSQTVPVSLGFPAGSVIDKVDVFLLFDDTGSFAGTVPSVTQIFSQLVGQLQTALPQVSFGFGVGRFEDYGGTGTSFSGENTTGRPFTLNQPIVTPEVPNFLNLINSALNRTAPGFGGDGPETTLEALFQIATGLGFDGNGNGSLLNSGAAGAPLTQTSPGTSGDIPPFLSNVAPASGTLGGVGFRPGALHLVITAGDICTVAAFPTGTTIPTTIKGAGGATVPTSALRCSNTLGFDRYGFVSNSLSTTGNTVSAAVAPRGSATVQATIDALNALGISVIGLAPGGVAIRNPVGPSTSPNVSLSALALLTGATDATGNPLVFNISGGTGPIRTAIAQAVTTAATRPRDVSLTFAGVPAGLGVTFTPPVVPGVGPG